MRSFDLCLCTVSICLFRLASSIIIFLSSFSHTSTQAIHYHCVTCCYTYNTSILILFRITICPRHAPPLLATTYSPHDPPLRSLSLRRSPRSTPGGGAGVASDTARNDWLLPASHWTQHQQASFAAVIPFHSRISHLCLSYAPGDDLLYFTCHYLRRYLYLSPTTFFLFPVCFILFWGSSRWGGISLRARYLMRFCFALASFFLPFPLVRYNTE